MAYAFLAFCSIFISVISESSVAKRYYPRIAFRSASGVVIGFIS
jgi:hypothetical protein